MRPKNSIFWNVKDPSTVDDKTRIEHTIKYGKFKDMQEIFLKYDKKYVKKVWLETTAWDTRFINKNIIVATTFFDMDVDKKYFLELNENYTGRFGVKLSIK